MPNWQKQSLFIRLLADQSENYFLLTSPEWVKVGHTDLKWKLCPTKAQDLQYETTITAKKWRDTTVCSSHENSQWRWTEGLTTDCAFWEGYAQALIGAIKRCDGGVSITMATEMEFFNTAAYWLVNLLRLQLMDKHLMRIWCSSITWINIFISET